MFFVTDFFFRLSGLEMWPPLQMFAVWDGACAVLRKTAVMKNSYFYKGGGEKETLGQ